MHIDWNIVNTVGCWFGGIFAAIAAFYTIKQFRQNYCKNIKLKVNYQLIFLNTVLGGGYVCTQLCLKIMNNSNIRITIEECGVNFNNTNYAILGGTRMPVTIEPNATEILSIPVVNLYKEFTQFIEQGQLKEKDKLNFYVRDSFDEIYKIKTKVTYKQIKGYATMNPNN